MRNCYEQITEKLGVDEKKYKIDWLFCLWWKLRNIVEVISIV